VVGLIGTDYSRSPQGIGTLMDNLTDEQKKQYIDTLKFNGAWLEDDACTGRLVYINGRFVPSLSFSSDIVKNLSSNDFETLGDDMIDKMNRLTDGFTDRLAADVPSGETDFLTSLKKLSGPDHNVGEPYRQFALNNQQGTACFVALNSVRAGCAAMVHVPKETSVKPVLIVNAITANGGVEPSADSKGVAIHPRTLVIAEAQSEVSVIQSFVNLDDPEGKENNAKFINGCTQMYVGEEAKVKHSYLEECGGMATGNVEASDEEFEEGATTAREMESKRKSLSDTHLESIDVHLVGDNAVYEGAVMELGGNGRSRIAVSTSLLRPGTHASVNGFVLSGGAQRSEMRTNIHHVAQGCTSRQSQKNMIGGRSTGTFRGRIRVEQSAQQTDSEQLARTILMTDKARAYAIPSLEIIADDVTCTHGATVSDLSEEELFYLRSRGVDRTTARNILMYGFVTEVASKIDEAVHGGKDDPQGLKNRIIKKLQNIVPKGEKTEYIGDEFQSV
jgi:Fe-S cluster assembly scaffold protein SufB